MSYSYDNKQNTHREANSHDAQPLPEDEVVFETQQQPREDMGGMEKPKEGGISDRLRVNLSSIDPSLPYGKEEATYEFTDEGAIPNKALDSTVASAPADCGLLRRASGCFTKVAKCLNYVIPYGGMLSSSFNLASATLGAGIISTPSAFNLSGVVMAVVFLTLVLIGTIYSLHLIARVVEKTGFRTFAETARHLLGPGADHFIATLLIILCFGGSVSYVIATSTLLVPVLNQPGSPSYLKTRPGNRVMTSVVWFLLMLPLAIPKQINSLRYVSTFGIFFVIYFVACMVVHSAKNGLKDPEIQQQVAMVRTGNAALEGLSVLIFALMSQINAFEICTEMRPFTVFRFTLYSTIAMVGCAVLYVLAGFFGYADFGSRVKDSVLSLYNPVQEPYIAVGYVGIIVKICVAFALHMIPFRDAVYHFLRWNVAKVPYWQHALVMTAICTAALICGLFIPTINTVFGLMGSFCGGIIGMIMPALFFMYCGNFSLRKVGPLAYFGTYLLLVGGCVAVVFGTTTTIYSTVGNSFV